MKKNELALINTQPTKPLPENVRVLDAIEAVSNFYRSRQAGLSGSLTNGLSGMGGVSDKSMFFQFLPFWLNSRQFIENITINSWAADRFVRMPIDDMFTRTREYDDEVFEAYTTRLGTDQAIAKGMRLARKLGTAIMWVVIEGSDPEEPLNLDHIRPNDVVNLIVLDRYDISVLSTNVDIFSQDFGKPEFYRLNVHKVGSFTVHASHLYRFEGMSADSINGWTSYQKAWGISNLAHAMNEVFNDASVVQGVSHLLQEASIPVQKVDGLAEILCGGELPDEPSVDEKMQEMNKLKSIYRTLFIDKRDDFSREAVNFSHIPKLMEKFSERLAMAAGVSATRFLNQSPDGQNSTGKGDMLNDNRTTSARQQHMLKPVYDWLDQIIARAAGVAEAPEYVFPPLFELTDKEKAEVTEIRSKAANNMVGDGMWDEDEGKHYVSTGVMPTGKAIGEATGEE